MLQLNIEVIIRRTNMSGANEFREYFSRMDEEQSRLDKERQKQQEKLDQVTAEILKALGYQQEEDPVMKTINDVLKRVDTFRGKSMNVKIMTKDLKELEETCPEFADATQTGFSEEEIKYFIVTMFDAFFGSLNIGRLENTLTNVMISVKCGKKIDFSQFSGIGAYNYIKSDERIFSQYLKPEFKKKIIYSRAVSIVTKEKTISFNTAVKRAVREICQNGFSLKMDAEDQEFLDDISGIINPLIDLYIENEVEIISAIARKIK